jgi:hypothetical protein
MNFRFTKHQVPRGTRADSETFDKIILIKNVSVIRVTYQIKLLAFQATETKRKLLILVPTHCKIHATLRELMKAMPKIISVERRI